MNSFLRLNKSELREFNKSQYKYYEKFNFSVLFLSVVFSLTYFVSDCQLFGRFAFETILSRFSILIIYAGYLILVHRYKNFYFRMIASQIVGHSIMWCTIWSIYFLPNRQYASDGFLILQVVILMLGFASSFWVSAISQLLVIGNILISNTFNHYEDLSLMLSLGLPLASGIVLANYVFTQSYYERYEMTRELKRLSYIDQLTNIYNRHKLDDLIEDNKLKCKSFQDISVIMTDIDFFKKINDTYGHEIGDVVLQGLAKVLSTSIDSNSYAIRYGGEEFLLVLYGYNEEEAFKLAEKIRKQVEGYNNEYCKITISLGVAENNKEVDYTTVISYADKALYKAKNTGRNKTVKYSEIINA